METETIRIFPVLHAPEINSRLFSLGQFHQSGLISVGGVRGVSLFKQNKLFFTATPKRDTSTTYYLQGLVGHRDQNLIYKVDFETMHRQMMCCDKPGNMSRTSHVLKYQ